MTRLSGERVANFDCSIPCLFLPGFNLIFKSLPTVLFYIFTWALSWQQVCLDRKYAFLHVSSTVRVFWTMQRQLKELRDAGTDYFTIFAYHRHPSRVGKFKLDCSMPLSLSAIDGKLGWPSIIYISALFRHDLSFFLSKLMYFSIRQSLTILYRFTTETNAW